MRLGRSLSPRSAAIAAAAITFTLYLATAPRTIVGAAGIDTAKFGYMARILGVPHAPGYPLYLLIGWAFSWLPVGTLAFRMNLLSACFGAATVACVAVVAIELGCAPVVAAIAAVLAGTGRLYWSQAIVAEVYTLHTLLVTAMFASLLVWQRTARVGWLYGAAFCFGLGLAHHTDIAVLVPAVLAFVWLVDRRQFARPRVVAGSAVAATAPLVLYAYTIVRTRQGAEFVEAGATNVRDVIGLVTGRQFGYLIMRTGLIQSLVQRGPAIAGYFVDDLGYIGVAAAAAGAVWLWRTNRAAAAFVVLGTAGFVAFALSYFAFDINVFLLPAFLLCWAAVAVALNRLMSGTPRMAATAAAIALLWCAGQAIVNFAPNNLRAETADGRFFDALFADMRPGSAIVDEAVDVSQMVLYKVLGERAAAARPVTLVVPAAHGALRMFAYVKSTPEHPVVSLDADGFDAFVRSGREVYVFGAAAQRLHAQGFTLEPLRFVDRAMPDYLAAAGRRAIVAAAVPAIVAPRLMPVERAAFRPIGGARHLVGGGDCVAIIGRAGVRAAESSGRVARAEIERGARLGPEASPVTITAECSETAASIKVDGREVARSAWAVPIVTIDASGRVLDETVATPESNFHVPFDWRWLPIYRIAGPRQCVAVDAGDWTDVTGGSPRAGLAMHLPARGALQLYVASDVALRPRLAHVNTTSANVRAASASGEAELSSIRGALEDPVSSDAMWTRIDVDASFIEDDSVVDVVFGGVARAVVARVRNGDPAARAEACALTVGNQPVLSGRFDGFERVLADTARDEIFGAGWYDFEHDANGGFVWSSSRDGHLTVPLGVAGPLQVSVDALMPAAAPGEPPRLALVVNGHELEWFDAAPGWQTYTWRVPANLLRRGVNDVVVRAGRVVEAAAPDTRVLGVCVRELDFAHPGPTAATWDAVASHK